MRHSHIAGAKYDTNCIITVLDKISRKCTTKLYD